MIRVGLTGGIGSGKTTVAKAFAALGAPIYNADERSKQLLSTNKKLITALHALLGDEVVKDGHVDRRAMAAKIFSDQQLLGKVNAVIHPAVYDDYAAWAEKQEELGAAYTVFEAAIIIENGRRELFDRLIVVTAPIEMRIERAMQRDCASRAEIEKRVGNQLSDEVKIAQADHVIVTDDSHFIWPEITEIDKEIRCLAR